MLVTGRKDEQRGAYLECGSSYTYNHFLALGAEDRRSAGPRSDVLRWVMGGGYW